MPQININEIDESVYTRVVTDDLVRVLIPGIASFGPIVDSSTSDFGALTFTNVNDWEKLYGYTEPEYNPFEDDISRIYAKQLMDRGAAITFIRVNEGETSYYYKTPEEGQPALPDLDSAASHNDNNFNVITDTIADWATTYNTYYNKVNGTYVLFESEYEYTVVTFTGEGTTESPYVPAYTKNTYYTKSGDTYTLLTSDNAPQDWGTADTFYTAAAVAPTQPARVYSLKETGKFCPQIEYISAKYTGSFGNRLLVTFTPVTSQNKSLAYQYSMASVYRTDITVKTTKDASGIIHVTKEITGVHKLESHLVTSNPNDINYFGNEDLFNYIIIHPTQTAKSELSLIWSNPTANPVDNNMYSGFPEISLKYTTDEGYSVYNTDALMTGGTDFKFDDGLTEEPSLQDILSQGFGGFDVEGTTGKVTQRNIDRWIWACYKPENGVVSTVLDNIANCYKNYTDPYIYDMDFVTSGGFVDETGTITRTRVNTGEIIDVPITTQEEFITALQALASRPEVWKYDSTNDQPVGTLQPIHTQMRELVTTRQDCIALIDTGADWEPEELPEYVQLLNTSYATVHAPWCYCNNPYASGTLLMPPSFIFLHTLLSNLINNTEAQKWFPPAGVTRATARIVVKPKYEIGSVLLNAWQNDTLSRVNPIMKLKSFGYVIYGQYTAYTAQDEYTHSALESLNVRLISNCVKKQIFNTCLKLAFEPNNSSLWMKFYDAMDKYLLFMKRNDGLYDYRIQMDEGTVTTDDINELRCPGKVWINPTRTAEFFDIDFILTEAGVTFTDVAGEGE